MLCPNCKTQYEATQSMCPDCFADLIEEGAASVQAPPQDKVAPTGTVPVEPPTRREPRAEKASSPPPAFPARSQVRPAGRVRPPEPSSSGDLFTWSVAVALVLGLGVGGWHLAHRAGLGSPVRQTAAAELPSADKSLAEARRQLSQGHHADAAREARLALTLLGPQARSMATRPAREVLAEALLKGQEYERASEEYRRLAAWFPEDSRYQEGLKAAGEGLNVARRAQAEDTWQKARRSFAAGRYREAADLADSASLSYASLGDARQRLECRRLSAQAYSRQGDWRSALYAWGEVLQARPDDRAAQAGLAEAEGRLQASVPPPRVVTVRPHRPAPKTVIVSQAPAPVPETQPAYPTAARKKDDFYSSDVPPEEGPRPPRSRPQRGPAPEGGEEDPYGDAPPPPPAGGEDLPPLPPPGGPPAAAPRPQLPRLPSLTYPSQARGNGIPGYTPPQRGGTNWPNSLPGYYSEKGRPPSGSGIPGL